jgi:hypothetical protein
MTWAISCGICGDVISRYSQLADRKIMFTDLETDKGKGSNMANLVVFILNFTVDPAAPTTVTVLPLLANNTLLHQSTVSPGQTMSYSPVDLAYNPPIMFQLNGITVPFPSGLAQQPSCFNGQGVIWSICKADVTGITKTRKWKNKTIPEWVETRKPSKATIVQRGRQLGWGRWSRTR